MNVDDNIEKAETLFKEAKRLYDSATVELDFDLMRKASEKCIESISYNHKHVEAYQLFYIVSIAFNDWDEIINLFEKAVRYDDMPISFYYHLANAYEERGKYDMAEHKYTIAAKSNPKIAEPLSKRAEFYKKQQKYIKAIADIDDAICLEKNAGNPFEVLQKQREEIVKCSNVDTDLPPCSNPKSANFYCVVRSIGGTGR